MRKTFSRGALLMMLAAFFFSLMAAFVKLSGKRLPSQEIVLFRSIVVLGITAALIRRKKLPFFGNNRKLLFLRGLTGFLALTALYFTLTHIPITDSVMLHFTNPLFAGILAGVLLKEKSSKSEWIFYLAAFAGIVLIINPGFSIGLLPAAIGLGGALCSATAYNLVRKLRSDDHPLTIIFYLPLVSIIFSIPIVAPGFVMPRGWEWLALLGVGLATQLAQIFLTLSLHAEKTARVANVSYLTVVFSTIFGIFFWNEIPQWNTILGSIIVLYAIFRISRIPEEEAPNMRSEVDVLMK